MTRSSIRAVYVAPMRTFLSTSTLASAVTANTWVVRSPGASVAGEVNGASTNHPSAGAISSAISESVVDVLFSRVTLTSTGIPTPASKVSGSIRRVTPGGELPAGRRAPSRRWVSGELTGTMERTSMNRSGRVSGTGDFEESIKALGAVLRHPERADIRVAHVESA